MADLLKFLKLHPAASLPTRRSEHAAGLDLFSLEEITIHPGERAAVKTGLSVSIPRGFYGKIAANTGSAVSHGVSVLAGVIDSDYRGEIVCVIINLGENPFHIAKEGRIAQLIIRAILLAEPQWAENLDDTERGECGFGSTGSN